MANQNSKNVNSNSTDRFHKVLAIQGLNALENALRKQGIKTERTNVPLYKKQDFFNTCGKNLLPLKQVPELVAGQLRYGLMVRLDAASRPFFKICVGMSGDPARYAQATMEENAQGWLQRSIWWQPTLTREERGYIGVAMADAAAVIAEKFESLDIGLDERGRLAFAKVK